MRKKHFLLLLLVSFLAVWMLNSCSNSSSPTDDTNNLFPVTNNSYWIFNKYPLDMNNAQVTTGQPTVDSIVITGTLTKLSKTASVFADYINQAGTYIKSGESYAYTENKKIFIHSDLIKGIVDVDKLPIKLPFDVPEQWIQVADPNSDKWDILTQPITNVTINVPSYGDFIVNGTLKIAGKKSGTENITVNGSSLNANKFTMTVSFDGTITYMSYPVALSFSRNLNFWFVNNVGKVREQLETVQINFPIVPKTTLYGYESNVVSYNVVK
jgi:hypothetical protein